MKKKILFTFLGCCFLGLAMLGWPRLCGTLVEWKVRQLCEDRLGASFTYESAQRIGSGLRFRQVILKNTSGESDWECLVKDLHLGYKLKGWRFGFAVDLQLLDPHLSLKVDETEGLSLPSLLGESGLLADHPLTMTIQNGAIEVTEGSGVRVLHHLQVDGELSLHERLLFRGNLVQGEGELSLLVHGTGDNFLLQLEASEFGLKPLQCLTASVFAEDRAWRLSHGKLNGSVDLEVKGGHWMPRRDSSLELTQLLLDLPDQQVSGNMLRGSVQWYHRPANRGDGVYRMASFRIDEAGSLAKYLKGDTTSVSLHDLKGEWDVYSDQSSHLSLRGKLRHDGSLRDVKVEAEVDSSQDFFGHLSLRGPSSDGLQLAWQGQPGADKSWELQGKIQRMGHTDWSLIHRLLGDSSSLARDWDWRRGNLDTDFSLRIKSGSLLQWSLDQLSAEHLEIGSLTQGLELRVPLVAGNVRSNLNGELDGALAISDAQVSWNREGDTPLEIDDLDGNFVLDHGVLQKADCSWRHRELQGSLRLDWTAANEVMALSLTGAASDLPHFLPESYRPPFEMAWADQQIYLRASGVRSEKGQAQVHGTLSMAAEEQDQLHFGFDCFREVCRFPLTQARSLFDQLSFPCEVVGIRVKEGWFSGQQVPLDRYLSPLVTRSDQVRIRGFSDVKGSFEKGQVSVLYNGKEVEIQGPSFRATAPALIPTTGEYAGVHHLDLRSGRHYGTLPLREGSFEQVGSGLVYHGISGSVNFSGSKVEIHQARAQAEGVVFQGSLALDFSPGSPGSFDVNIATQEIAGSLTNVGRLLRHYLDTSWDVTPIQAKLHSQSPASLHLKVRPEGLSVDAHIQGRMVEGTFAGNMPGLAVEGLEADFTYDHRRKSLDIRQLQGKVLVGAEGVRDEYTLRGPHLRVYSFPSTQADFDIRLEGRTRDIARLVGNTARAPEYGPGAVHVVLHREHSHLGTIQPNISNLVLRDWTQVLAFEAEPTANVKNLLGDLQRMAPTGCLGVSKETLTPLSDFALSGEILGHLDYNHRRGALNFSLNGDRIRVDDQELSSCQLRGARYADRWVVDQLWLDQLSLSFDVSWRGEDCRVNFAGGRYGDMMLLGLDGEYTASDRCFSGLVNLLEVDLEKSQPLSLFPQTVAWTKPKGKLFGRGTFEARYVPEWPFVQLGASLNGQAKGLEVCGLPFQPVEEIHCQVDSQKGLSLSRVGLEVDHSRLGVVPMGIWLDQIAHSWPTGAVQIQGLHFKVPSANLPFLSQRLGDLFPQSVGPATQELVAQLQQEGSLQGILEVDLGSTYQSFLLELDEGDYQVLGQSHHLRDLKLEHDPNATILSLQYRYQDRFYGAQLKADSGDLHRGEALFTAIEADGTLEKVERPLQVLWEWDKSHGLGIRRAEGELAGCQLHLNAIASGFRPDSVALGGQIRLDAARAKCWLSENGRELVDKLQLGQGLEFNGHVTLSKKHWGQLAAEGVLGGKDFVLAGHRFKTLFAHLDMTPEKLLIQKLRLSDVSGEGSIDQILCQRNEVGDWELEVPELRIEDFRPSLMRSVQGEPAKPKALLVREVELRGLKGTVGRPETFRGEGRLQFVNPSKGNIQNTLLAIPTDIIARIGLDPNVLTPVVGTLHYHLGDNRVWLDRLQDTFSEGRVSQFYLAEGASGSYMDFDGNLNVKVRMKQYNIIFKLAELLTISVRGQIGEPYYSLQNPPDSFQVSSPEESPEMVMGNP